MLIVHGRDFKPAHDTLLDLAVDAMRAGIARDYPDCLPAFDALDVRMAYYGDLTNALLESSGQHYDEPLDVGDRRNALEELKKIQARKRFGIRQYDRLPGKSALPEFFADFFYTLAGWLGLAMPIVARVSRDFAVYLKGEGKYGETVRERLRTPLCELLERGDDVMLVSHGTGSAVAWDVLWELSHDPGYAASFGECKIDRWVTLGSPLSDNRIRKRLSGARQKGAARFPTNLISWDNVSAEDDYTCHDKTVADDFSKMMKTHVVSAVRDYRIFNHAVRYGCSNPHSSVGYFIHPRLSKIIVDWLGAAAGS